MNYYEVLEVAPDAPQNEIHRAYQRAKTTYSQDNPALYSMFSRDEARELLRMVEEAYAILGNHALRKSYDDTLLKAGLHSMAMSAPLGKAAATPVAIASSMSASEPDHAALPDFMVPDPSIPGSTDHRQFEAPPLSVVPAMTSPSHQPSVSGQSFSALEDRGSAMDAAFRQDQKFSAPHESSTETPRSESVMVAGEDFTVRRRESATPSAIPAGHAKLPLATYKIDPEIEARIAAQTVYDGPFLKMVREYRGIPMDKLSETSRIGKTYLLAIEGNDMRSLPAPVFLRGFLVQIAKHLGLDGKLVVESYLNMVKDQSKK